MFVKKSLISLAFCILLVTSSDDECCIGPICLCFFVMQVHYLSNCVPEVFCVFGFL